MLIIVPSALRAFLTATSIPSGVRSHSGTRNSLSSTLTDCVSGISPSDGSGPDTFSDASPICFSAEISNGEDRTFNKLDSREFSSSPAPESFPVAPVVTVASMFCSSTILTTVSASVDISTFSTIVLICVACIIGAASTFTASSTTASSTTASSTTASSTTSSISSADDSSTGVS